MRFEVEDFSGRLSSSLDLGPGVKGPGKYFMMKDLDNSVSNDFVAKNRPLSIHVDRPEVPLPLTTQVTPSTQACNVKLQLAI